MTSNSPQAAAGERSELVAGRLVLEDRLAAGRIRVEGGRIVEVTLDESVTEGPYVCPGFVDLHVHGWGGYDGMAGADQLAGMARALLLHGVTAFLPTAVTSSLEDLRRFADEVRGWMPIAAGNGAEPLGFNLEGPFIALSKAGAHNPAHIHAPAATPRAELTPMLEGLRLMTVAPEVEGAGALIGWLHEQRVVVALGHSNASAAQARAGYDAGARTTTHLFNAMSGIGHHAPGLAAVALARDDVAVELIADGLHVDPLLWPVIFRSKPANRVILVSDALSVAGTTDGRTRLGGLEVEVRDEACRLVSDGRLAGSVLALDSAVRNLARAGLDLPRAVAAATRNPCELFGLEDRGRLAPGCRADLVVLDDRLRVVRVMRAGAWQPGAGPPSESQS